MVAFRFRMQLRPRPRCELPLGGISRRGSASVVPFLYAVRLRRPTHIIFDWGGGRDSDDPVSDEFQNVAGSQENVAVGGPDSRAGRRGTGHHAGRCRVPPVFGGVFETLTFFCSSIIPQVDLSRRREQRSDGPLDATAGRGRGRPAPREGGGGERGAEATACGRRGLAGDRGGRDH